MIRPGRSLDVGIVVGPGRWSVRVEADAAVTVGIGDEGSPPAHARTLEGYSAKKSKRLLRIQNVSQKSKARGSYEVNGG